MSKTTDTIIEHSAGNTELIEKLMFIITDQSTKLSALKKVVEENENTIDMLYKWMCEKEGIEV